MASASQSSPLTAGIDIGTTSVKALVVDEDGHTRGRGRAPSALRVGPGGTFEHDASATWWSAPRQVLARAAGAGLQPGAVAVSAMMPSAVAVEADGGPLGPGLLYGDSRGRGAAVAAEGPDNMADPLASLEMSRFCSWLAGTAAAGRGPGGGTAAAGYWPAQAVANAALGGEGVVDLSTAFACGPLLGPAGWDDAACALAGLVPAQLPRMAFFGEAIGQVGSNLLAASGSPEGAVLAAGGVDGFCEQLVSGAAEDGDVLITLGSTLVVWLTVPGWPEAAPGMWRLPHVMAGKAMVGGASNAGGMWADWARRVLGPVGDEAGPGGPPGNVPIWWPWARGERVPWHDPALSVRLAGADISQGPGALLRAAYEATGFVVRYLVGRAEQCGTPARRFIVSGGGTANGAWLQAIADALGRPVVPMAMPEGAALGAAFLARMALGLETSLEDARRWSAWAAPVEPRPAWVAAVSERYERWCEGLPA
jgi:xylulokinase